MSIALLKDTEVEANILTVAFHANVITAAQAKKALKGQCAGSFLTFAAQKKNYCAVVEADGSITVRVFRWDVSGSWFNLGSTPYGTEWDLLDHLVSHQTPIPFVNQ